MDASSVLISLEDLAGRRREPGAARNAGGDSSGPRLEVAAGAGRIYHLGWDTEGGDRAAHNLLRAPLFPDVQISGEWSEVWRPAHAFSVECSSPSAHQLEYRFGLAGHLGPLPELIWSIRLEGGGMFLHFASRGQAGGSERVSRLRLRFAFDLDVCATTVIAGTWSAEGRPVLPAVISAPDHGEILLRCEQHPGLEGAWQGSRPGKYADLTLELPAPDEAGCELELKPVLLPAPSGLRDEKLWPAARRGWANLLQVHVECGKLEDEKPSPSGVWANNVISNAVSSLLFMLGDHVLMLPELAPGVPLAPLLGRTIDYFTNEEIAPDGRIHYFENGSWVWHVMDSNPAVLIAAWCFVETTGDVGWLRERIERLEFVAAYLEARDVDGDGLLESEQTGNSGSHARPDAAWDTFCSGHKNAYINALAYRAFRCMAELEDRLGRADAAGRYRERADRLKAAYRPAFHNPETGWLGWWRSQDGVLHDVHSDVPTSIATAYDLISPDDGRSMLETWWKALGRTGFDRFDLGLPLMLRPVSRADQISHEGRKLQRYFVAQQEDGMDTFGRWLNGGCCVSNTCWFLLASYVAGERERADRILEAMLRRQAEGVFPNGGGFQNGVLDMMPFGAEFFEWDGKTSGYEGHLVYSWGFLQCLLLREEAVRARVLRPLAGR